ncbi:MAG TPA: FecR family protein [Candidatus Sulfotelmatobacter sp.]|nr:FecR family protein [Candidatus Sulfotelmatobacter sp.]
MKRTWRRVGVGTIAVLFIGYVGLVAVSLIALVVASANLTVFLGQVHVQRTGSAAAGLGHSGDQLQSGDVVKTAHDTKAAVGYPDGSLSRLDSDSTMQVKSIKGSNGVWNYQLLQSNGKVWSRVVALSRGSSFEIDAPNSTTVEVRGTEFEIIVDSSSGPTVTRVNSWRGAVTVAAQGSTVTVTGGQSSTVRAGSAPTDPAPIPAADRTDGFATFNFAVDAAQGAVLGVYGGSVAAGQPTGAQTAGMADGTTDLEITLSWPATKFELSVISPTGSSRQFTSDKPPITDVVPLAAKGLWDFAVQALDAKSPQPYWVVVSWRPRPAEMALAGSAFKSWADSHDSAQNPQTASDLVSDETGAQQLMDQAGLKIVATPGAPMKWVFTSGEYTVNPGEQLYVSAPGQPANFLAMATVTYRAGTQSSSGQVLVLFSRSPGVAWNAAATAPMDAGAVLPALAISGDGYLLPVPASESNHYLVGIDELGQAMAADIGAGLAGHPRDPRFANDPSLEGIIKSQSDTQQQYKGAFNWTLAAQYSPALEYPAYAYRLADGSMLELTEFKATFTMVPGQGRCVEQPSHPYDASGVESTLIGPARGVYGTVTQSELWMVAVVVPPKDSGQTVQILGGRSQVVDWSTTPCTGSGSPGTAYGDTGYF